MLRTARLATRRFRTHASGVVTLLAALAILGTTTAEACSSQRSRTGGHLDYDLISALASSADGNAKVLESHADAISTAAESRGDRSRWLGLADKARNAAVTLRLLSSNAAGVVRVRKQGLDDPSGMLSDGLSILRPGESLLKQVAALEAEIRLLRGSAIGDQDLLTHVDALGSDAKEVNGNAETATQQGTLLVDQARQLGRSLGIDLK